VEQLLTLLLHPFTFGYCVVCPSNFGFWLPLWYNQSFSFRLLQKKQKGEEQFPRKGFWVSYISSAIPLINAMPDICHGGQTTSSCSSLFTNITDRRQSSRGKWQIIVIQKTGKEATPFFDVWQRLQLIVVIRNQLCSLCRGMGHQILRMGSEISSPWTFINIEIIVDFTRNVKMDIKFIMKLFFPNGDTKLKCQVLEIG